MWRSTQKGFVRAPARQLLLICSTLFSLSFFAIWCFHERMIQLSKIIFRSNYPQDHLIVRLKIWLRTVWRFKEVFLEFFFRYKLFSDRALSNLKSIGIEQVRLDSTIFARQPPNVCTSSSRDERWREEEKIVAKKDYLRRLIADRHLLSRMILTVRKRHCLTHVTTAALSLAMAANGQRPEIPLPDVVWYSWLPYSTYPYLDFHLLCSMTKLKEHSREIC